METSFTIVGMAVTLLASQNSVVQYQNDDDETLSSLLTIQHYVFSSPSPL